MGEEEAGVTSVTDRVRTREGPPIGDFMNMLMSFVQTANAHNQSPINVHLNVNLESVEEKEGSWIILLFSLFGSFFDRV